MSAGKTSDGMAAIDRLVHHATILEFDGESVRTKKPNPGSPREAHRPWLVAFRQSGYALLTPLHQLGNPLNHHAKQLMPTGEL